MNASMIRQWIWKILGVFITLIFGAWAVTVVLALPVSFVLVSYERYERAQDLHTFYMMTALAVGLLVVVGLLIVWIRKIEQIAQDQKGLWRRLNSISRGPGWIRVADETGKMNIRGGSLWMEGPHGMDGPELHLRTVPGTADSYPFDFHGSASQEKVVSGGGFDIEFTTPTLPHMPLPPHIRLEFRDDTLTIRTWKAKVENAEWQIGDGY